MDISVTRELVATAARYFVLGCGDPREEGNSGGPSQEESKRMGPP